MPLGWFQANNDHYYHTSNLKNVCWTFWNYFTSGSTIKHHLFFSVPLSPYLLKLYANLRLRIPFLAIIGKIKTRNGNVNDTILCQIIHLLPLWQSCPKHALSIWKIERSESDLRRFVFYVNHNSYIQKNHQHGEKIIIFWVTQQSSFFAEQAFWLFCLMTWPFGHHVYFTDVVLECIVIQMTLL